MITPITVGLSPNTQYDDVLRALSMMFTPWKWKHGIYENRVRMWFEKYYPHTSAVFFSSGRSALTALLLACGIGEHDEVLIQAFTCMVVPNAVRFSGATPIYVDIDETANMDPKQIEQHITQRTKAIIVQHTFGTPASMNEILAVARKHNLLVIEDCAHAFGATYHGKKVGTIGDGAIISFGRDKIISSVMGGVALVRSKTIASKLTRIQKRLSYPSFSYVFQQLVHPIAMSVILPLYVVGGIGKMILFMLQKIHWVTRPVAQCELEGSKPSCYMMKYPNGLAYLLLGQLKKLSSYQKNRIDICKYYKNECTKQHIQYITQTPGSSCLRFSIITPYQHNVIVKAKQKGILLGNWYHNGIDPIGSSFTRAKYNKGSCPNAESLALEVVNLPTRITLEQAKKVMKAII